jgi:hypothetical protein
MPGGSNERGTRCLWLKGNGPASIGGPNSITTVTVSNSRCEGTTGPEAILINHGLGLVFNRVIVQGNAGAAFRVQRASSWPGARIEAVVLRDVWMEANGAGIVNPAGVAIQVEGSTGSW